MSFRRRLLLTVFLILIVPIGAIGFVLLQLAGESRTGKADARLAGAMPAVLAIYRVDLGEAREEARSIASSRALPASLSGQPAGLNRLLNGLARAHRLSLISLSGADGRILASSQTAPAVASAEVQLRGANGSIRYLTVSVTPAQSFVRSASNQSGVQLAIAESGGAGAAASTPDATPLALRGSAPQSEDVSLGSGQYRARALELPDARGPLRLVVLGPRGSSALSGDQVLIGVVLLIFVLAALVLIVPLLRDLHELHARAEQEAITDELTGLSNRRRFEQIIARESERATRFGRPLSLLLIDLDDFKPINDNYGHLQGDEVLRQVAALLQSSSRAVDEPARWGGEEFAIALPESDIEGAIRLAERIRLAVQEMPIRLRRRGDTLQLTASAGVSGTPAQSPRPAELIEAADQALYRAKRAGKNRTERASRSAARDPAPT